MPKNEHPPPPPTRTQEGHLRHGDRDRTKGGGFELFEMAATGGSSTPRWGFNSQVGVPTGSSTPTSTKTPCPRMRRKVRRLAQRVASLSHALAFDDATLRVGVEAYRHPDFNAHISKWDTGRVTNTAWMFYDCRTLIHSTPTSRAGTPATSLTNMGSVFSGCLPGLQRRPLALEHQQRHDQMGRLPLGAQTPRVARGQHARARGCGRRRADAQTS